MLEIAARPRYSRHTAVASLGQLTRRHAAQLSTPVLIAFLALSTGFINDAFTFQAEERMARAQTRAGLITKTFKGEVSTPLHLPF